MDTYIIRIFRRSEQDPEEIIGTTEHIETGQKQGFKDLKNLCGIIAKPGPDPDKTETKL